MEQMTFINVFVFVAVALLTTSPPAHAVCCYDAGGQCGDCGEATPFCGQGSCNMFGCNCDGGCRKGTCESKKFDFEEFAEFIVVAGDSNGDGRLSIDEADILLEFTSENGPDPTLRKKLEDLDKNRDGFLTFDEIDD